MPHWPTADNEQLYMSGGYSKVNIQQFSPSLKRIIVSVALEKSHDNIPKSLKEITTRLVISVDFKVKVGTRYYTGVVYSKITILLSIGKKCWRFTISGSLLIDFRLSHPVGAIFAHDLQCRS